MWGQVPNNVDVALNVSGGSERLEQTYVVLSATKEKWTRL